MVRRGLLLALEGASGSGKTTLVRAATRALGWQPLPEAYDRLDPAPSLAFASSRELRLLEGTLLSEETRRFRAAVRACSAGRTVLADTGFFGPLTYTWGLVRLGRAPAAVGRSLSRSARSLAREGALGLPDLTVYLRTTTAERRRRARADARHHPAPLLSRHEAVGRFERRYFTELFPSALPGRFLELRADAAPATLVGRLRAIVEAADGVPASRADALAVLARLPPSRRRRRRSSLRPNR